VSIFMRLILEIVLLVDVTEFRSQESEWAKP